MRLCLSNQQHDLLARHISEWRKQKLSGSLLLCAHIYYMRVLYACKRFAMSRHRSAINTLYQAVAVFRCWSPIERKAGGTPQVGHVPAGTLQGWSCEPMSTIHTCDRISMA